MTIDVKKAFDYTSWNFLYNALEYFSFDNQLVKWIKLFNEVITTRIQQCGHLSASILIERGCRQVDTIAPNLSLIAAEAKVF